ncbi:histidine phosphatase family protein [Oceanicella sp. SM1341]|uniref:histidine phosphatase family protein n=1 Tax=Oceanicella sp. SM1341 TaxID=1548889 RepID=UPI000E54DBB9|nr:histidine phosphatase family protein [Oceanicella sp. SM1341]
MDSIVRYLSHPQVRLDPEIPVPDWGLSDIGRARAEAAAHAPWFAGARSIFSSAERKAVETAQCIGAPRGLAPRIRPAMHENDRSATGFLPPPEFERMADAFFARPDEAVRGWEPAARAQARILRETAAALAEAPEGDVLLVGHGAVGTLLACALSGQAIARNHDQPAGGGCYFSFTRRGRALLHGWQRLETPPPAPTTRAR